MSADDDGDSDGCEPAIGEDEVIWIRVPSYWLKGTGDNARPSSCNFHPREGETTKSCIRACKSTPAEALAPVRGKAVIFGLAAFLARDAYGEGMTLTATPEKGGKAHLDLGGEGVNKSNNGPRKRLARKCTWIVVPGEPYPEPKDEG